MSNIQIRHRIHPIRQLDTTLCWATVFAMLRHERTTDQILDIVSRAGLGNRENGIILDHEIPNAARANGLRNVPIPSPISVSGIQSVIRNAPAAFFVTLKDRHRATVGSSGHVILIYGLSGDGSDQTQVLLVDPWAGDATTRTFQYLSQTYWDSVDRIFRR